MALIKCSECKKEISTLARSCPSCGAPNSSTVKYSNNSNLDWSSDDDKKLLSLYKKNVPEFALAKILKKRLTDVRIRIIYLMKNNK